MGPFSLVLKIRHTDKKDFYLKLPGLLILPMFLFLFILLLPVVILVDVVGLFFLKFFVITRVMFALVLAFGALKGFQLHVQNSNEHIEISFA